MPKRDAAHESQATTSDQEYVVPLEAEAASRIDACGGKGARLSQMLRAALPVPRGFVVTIHALERMASPDGDLPPELCVALRRALETLGGFPVAVRSSAIAEDTAGASFAGQYESVLNVRGYDAVVAAVRVIFRSAFAPRVLDYRRRQGLSGPPRMAVVIQQMVDADAAGVAFSAHPVTGRRDQVFINAVKGLGERLVSGEATADEILVLSDDRVEPTRLVEHALTNDQALEVARLARRAAELSGSPQDIEWAFAGGLLHLLQARPITALPDEVRWEARASGAWSRTFRLGEWLGDPITPLFETWLLERMEARLFQRFRDVAPTPMERPYHVTVNGWYFTTINFVPRNIPQALWTMVRYVLPAVIMKPRRLSVLSTRFAHVGMALFEEEWRRTTREHYEAAVKTAEQALPHATAPELAEFIDKLADLAGDEVFYFFTVGGSAWKLEARLAAFYAKHLRQKIGGSHQDLLQGLTDNATLSPHVVVSLDWFHPTLGELDEHAAGAESSRPAEAAARREAAEAGAREHLRSSPALLKRFELMLRRAQHFGRVREDQARHLTLAWPVLRLAIEQFAKWVEARGLELQAQGDVYFLRRDELLSQLDGSVDGRFVEVAQSRRALWITQRRLDAPVVVGKMGFIQRRVFEGHGGLRSPSTDAALLHGAAASPGRATGHVRIVHDVAEFATMQAGEVLVAPATNPGWTPLFARAAAVVTDTGSAMAHASLVAREYGIPAVVGTGNATKQLRNGDLIVVDGNRGTVERAS